MRPAEQLLFIAALMIGVIIGGISLFNRALDRASINDTVGKTTQWIEDGSVTLSERSRLPVTFRIEQGKPVAETTLGRDLCVHMIVAGISDRMVVAVNGAPAFPAKRPPILKDLAALCNHDENRLAWRHMTGQPSDERKGAE